MHSTYVHPYSGTEIDGSIVGLAFIGTMCNQSYSAGVAQDGGAPLDRITTLAAHELGHVFNMRHDDGKFIVLEFDFFGYF